MLRQRYLKGRSFAVNFNHAGNVTEFLRRYDVRSAVVTAIVPPRKYFGGFYLATRSFANYLLKIPLGSLGRFSFSGTSFKVFVSPYRTMSRYTYKWICRAANRLLIVRLEESAKNHATPRHDTTRHDTCLIQSKWNETRKARGFADSILSRTTVTMQNVFRPSTLQAFNNP